MDDNIILFPHTIEQHLERGFAAIEERRFDEALQHFLAVTHYEPPHREANLASALCLFELHRFEEVIPFTSSLLNVGDDSYFEILRLHIEALIHTGQLDEAQLFLEALIEEEEVPLMFQQQAEMLKLMRNQERVKPSSTLQMKLEDEPEFKEKLLQHLHNGTLEQKQFAIEQMMFLDDLDLEKALVTFLMEDNDPVQKTFALQALKHMKGSGEVTLKKNNRTLRVELSSVPASPEEWHNLCKPVYNLLVENTESTSPSLTTFAVQLWMEYLFIRYPDIPTKRSTNLLAAAIHTITSEMLGMGSLEEVAEQYDVTEAALEKKVSDIRKTLQARAYSHS